MYAKAMYAFMVHLCHKSYLRTFGAYLSRKRFTRFVRKVFAREILPTGKFGLFVSPQLANEMARVKKRLFWFSTRFFSSFSLQCRHFNVYVYIQKTNFEQKNQAWRCRFKFGEFQMSPHDRCEEI